MPKDQKRGNTYELLVNMCEIYVFQFPQISFLWCLTLQYEFGRMLHDSFIMSFCVAFAVPTSYQSVTDWQREQTGVWRWEEKIAVDVLEMVVGELDWSGLTLSQLSLSRLR